MNALQRTDITYYVNEFLCFYKKIENYLATIQQKNWNKMSMFLNGRKYGEFYWCRSFHCVCFWIICDWTLIIQCSNIDNTMHATQIEKVLSSIFVKIFHIDSIFAKAVLFIFCSAKAMAKTINHEFKHWFRHRHLVRKTRSADNRRWREESSETKTTHRYNVDFSMWIQPRNSNSICSGVFFYLRKLHMHLLRWITKSHIMCAIRAIDHAIAWRFIIHITCIPLNIGNV